MGCGAETSEVCVHQEEYSGLQIDAISGPIPAGEPRDAAAVLAAAPASAVPQARSLPVPHIQQAYNWDCGLACALMVLRALGMTRYHFGTLLDLCPTRSIWTIDLAHLLAKCGAVVRMLTVTIGANQAYSGEQFYAETMHDDMRRVDALFRAAPAAGVLLQQRSLPLAQLRSLLLSGSCLLIALVDKVRLASASLPSHSSGGLGSVWSPGGVRRSGRLASEDGGSPASAPSGHAGGSSSSGDSGSSTVQQAAPAAAPGAAAGGQPEAGTPAAGPAGGRATAARPAAAAADGCSGGSDSGYLGHYIVLCGYDARSDEFEIRDPASDRPRLWIPAAQLEAARKCFGTDEDLLLVDLPASPAHTAGDAAGTERGSGPDAATERGWGTGAWIGVYG